MTLGRTRKRALQHHAGVSLAVVLFVGCVADNQANCPVAERPTINEAQGTGREPAPEMPRACVGTVCDTPSVVSVTIDGLPPVFRAAGMILKLRLVTDGRDAPAPPTPPPKRDAPLGHSER